MSKKILFTGGGSAGHVTVNLGLIPFFQKEGFKTVYIGSKSGIERELVANLNDVKYYSIQTGKLRRYFSIQNFIDIFKIPVGIIQAFFIVRKENPDIVFSKGGFVSFPVVVASWLNRKKVIMHESDITPGLANKISMPFVSKFFTTFAETSKYILTEKIQYVGPVISNRIKDGSKEKALQFLNFEKNKPTIMVMGGSLGAKILNDALRMNLDELLEKYQIVHLCGKGQLNKDVDKKGYAQFEYVDKELKDIIALSDIVVSRAGSNSIFELLSLRKPMILVPLSTVSSRGEQGQNANIFKENGYCEIIEDEELENSENFLKKIDYIYENKDKYIENMNVGKMKITSSEELFEILKKAL